MATPLPADTPEPVLVASQGGGVSIPGTAIVSDATPTETHEGKNTITDHPVEEGFNASDHSRPEPDRLTTEWIVSDTPLSIDQVQRAQRFMQQLGVVQAVGAGGAASEIVGVPGYSRAVRDRLTSYRVQGQMLTVVTEIRQYSSMMIESITETRTAEDGSSFHAQVVFKFVRVVFNKLTRRVQAKDPRAQTKVKGGNQTPQPDAISNSKLLNMGVNGWFGQDAAAAINTANPSAAGNANGGG